MKLRKENGVWMVGALLLLSSHLAFADDITVKGTVQDAQGEPLPGVTITVKGTTIGTITDAEGVFILPSISDQGVLVFSYIGYVSEEREVDPIVNVVLREDVQTLGEVVVTTQKRRQTSIEVPITVSALSGGSLEHLNLKQMDEMAAFIPGLQVQLQSPNNPGYVIRGVTSDGLESYSQPRISVFMDGVSISRAQASVVELFDMERVEVVKGPQGTLFGRGAEIGAMHFLRNKPTNELSAEVKVNYGSHNQRGAEGFLNTPFSEKVSNRFAFSYDAHDGYINNQAGGRLNGKSAIAVRNTTRLFAGENTSMYLILDYQHDNYPGTSFKGNQLEPLNGGDTSPYTEAYLNGGKDLGIDRDNGGATFLLDYTINPALKLSSITSFRAYKSNEYFDADGTYLPLLDCQEKAKGNQFSQELRLNWDNGGRISGFVGASYFYEHVQETVVANSNLQYTFPIVVGESLQSQLSGLPDQVAAGVTTGIESYVSQLKELYPAFSTLIDGMMSGLTSDVSTAITSRMNSLMESWFASSQWSATPSFYSDTNTAVNEVLTSALTELINEYPIISTLLGGASASDIVSSLDISSSLSELQAYSDIALDEDYQENYTNYATNQAADLFVDATWHIYKGLSLTAGLRGTYEHQKTGYSSTSDSAPLVGAILYHSSDGQRVWASDDYFSYVGRIALNYMFGRNNVYASVSRGRRPGVIYFDYDPDEVVKLKPEIIVSYEAGIKGNVLKSSLAYDFSIYYYDWSHFQSSRLESNDNGTKSYVYDDAGKAHSFGFEIGLRYSFTPNISIFGNYGYIDGKFNDTDENGVEQEMAGNRFRLTPKSSLAFGLDVNIPTGKKSMFYFRPSFTYKSKVYFENENTELLSQDGYGLVNCNLGIQWKPGKVYYELGFFGKNIFDEDYLIDAGNTGNMFGFPTFVAGSPSVYGASFKIGF